MPRQVDRIQSVQTLWKGSNDNGGNLSTGKATTGSDEKGAWGLHVLKTRTGYPKTRSYGTGPLMLIDDKSKKEDTKKENQRLINQGNQETNWEKSKNKYQKEEYGFEMEDK